MVDEEKVVRHGRSINAICVALPRRLRRRTVVEKVFDESHAASLDALSFQRGSQFSRRQRSRKLALGSVGAAISSPPE